MKADKKVRKKWSGVQEAKLREALKGSQIDIPELAMSIGFKVTTVRRRLSTLSSDMGLRVIGITHHDICAVRKAENTTKNKSEVQRFMCKCTGPTGYIHIQASATSKETARASVTAQYKALTVIEVFTQEEHNRNNRVKSSTPKLGGGVYTRTIIQ